MKVGGDQGDLSSAFQFPHPNKSESIFQRGPFIVLHFPSSSSIAVHQQHTFRPYGGRLSLITVVSLCGISVWGQQNRKPLADPHKSPLTAFWRTFEVEKRQLNNCQHYFHLLFHVFIMLSVLSCVESPANCSQSLAVSHGSADITLVTVGHQQNLHHLKLIAFGGMGACQLSCGLALLL